MPPPNAQRGERSPFGTLARPALAASFALSLGAAGACGARSTLEEPPASEVLGSGSGGSGAGGQGAGVASTATTSTGAGGGATSTSATSTGTGGGGPCALGDGAPCDDGDACTQTDTCQGGVCVGANPVVCPPVGACQSENCEPASGSCVLASLPDGTACDDGDPCTQDACAGGGCAGVSLASEVLFETRPWTTNDGVPDSAASALDLWDALPPAAPGYGSGTFPTAGDLSIQLWGSASDAASHFRVTLYVSPNEAGVWEIRVGPDFGFGGVLLLDGVTVDEDWGDLWWSGNWANGAELLQSGPLTVTSGWHTLEVFGFEVCCGGAMTIQVMKPGDVWTTATVVDLDCP